MKVNKVVLQNVDIESTILDLSVDTVSPEKVLKDEVFHMANGESAEGSLVRLSNIEIYKMQDLNQTMVHGYVPITDEEYMQAEVIFQRIYHNIMEGK